MLSFVTSNKRKFENAKRLLTNFSIPITQKDIPIYEIQSNSVEEILHHKAHQAYSQLHTPLLITDHGWSIPGLNGFPGPYMKFMNEWLTAQNFLDLTYDLEDRRIILEEVICYKDKNISHLFSKKHEGKLLKEIKGKEKPYPAMTLCTFDGKISEAEAIERGVHSFNSEPLWKECVDFLKNKII